VSVQVVVSLVTNLVAVNMPQRCQVHVLPSLLCRANAFGNCRRDGLGIVGGSFGLEGEYARLACNFPKAVVNAHVEFPVEMVEN
jgi:hypothetical protein